MVGERAIDPSGHPDQTDSLPSSVEKEVTKRGIEMQVVYRPNIVSHASLQEVGR